jgi:hypothetical protein
MPGLNPFMNFLVLNTWLLLEVEAVVLEVMDFTTAVVLVLAGTVLLSLEKVLAVGHPQNQLLP